MSKSLVVINNPQSKIAQRYKIFRANLQYARAKNRDKVILFTSTDSEDGKATAIANTAVAFAKAQKRVLLMDCNLYNPQLHLIFGINNRPGISELLQDSREFSEILKSPEGIQNLDILTSGLLMDSSKELFDTEAFEKLIFDVRGKYDIILVNAPPVLNSSDALQLSHLTDGVVLTIGMKTTKKATVNKAKMVLQKADAKILGVLLTEFEQKKRRLSLLSRGRKVSGVIDMRASIVR